MNPSDNKRVLMCPCGSERIPGLKIPLCQKHYDGLMFGHGKEHSKALEQYRKAQNGESNQ